MTRTLGLFMAIIAASVEPARPAETVKPPRPERPAIFAELRKNIPEYPLRQRVKPGITGWAQVNQAYDCCIDDVRSKVRYDLEYVRRQSVVEDLRIMSMTLPVMVFRKGGH